MSPQREWPKKFLRYVDRTLRTGQYFICNNKLSSSMSNTYTCYQMYMNRVWHNDTRLQIDCDSYQFFSFLVEIWLGHSYIFLVKKEKMQRRTASPSSEVFQVSEIKSAQLSIFLFANVVIVLLCWQGIQGLEWIQGKWVSLSPFLPFLCSLLPSVSFSLLHFSFPLGYILE